MIGKHELKPYNSKEIKILRANVIPRSEGDGEETTVTLPQAEVSGECSTFKKKVKLENKLKTCSKTELTKALQVNVELPSISNIAQKLDKVSLLSVPDPLILSAPPSDIDCKPKILLRPVEGYLPERKPSSFNKRREPKFVPYEPYKGCVKPIVGKKFSSKGCVAVETRSHLISKDENIDIASKEKEKVNLIIVDFEKEKSKWEKENNSLKTENQELQTKLLQSEKDLNQLQQQLSIQSQ
ncbi:hypothetical protein Anas_07714, partial [Armadillidium nasatum]